MVPVTCSSCGTAINEDPGLKPDERKPCPVCGSTVRNFSVTASLVVDLDVITSETVIPASLQSISAASDLLLQAVIVPGNRTAEGTLIEAVAFPWFDIIELLKNDPIVAFQIPAHKWEEIIAGAYHKAGFDEVTLTPRSGDHGRDVIAVKRGLGSIRVIDQVKAYKPGHLVKANDVRALMGGATRRWRLEGFLTTTSDFAPRLRTDALISPFIPSRLELIDGKTLLARLEQLAAKRR